MKAWQPIATAVRGHGPILTLNDGAPFGVVVPVIVHAIWLPDGRYVGGGTWADIRTNSPLTPSSWMKVPR